MAGLIVMVLCCVSMISVLTVIIWGFYQIDKKNNMNINNVHKKKKKNKKK